MEDKQYTIPLRIKEVMQEKGITGRELAAMMNKKPQYISNVVNGSGVSLNVLAEIAHKLQVDVKDLFSGSAPDPDKLTAFVEFRGQIYVAHNYPQFEAISKEINSIKSSEIRSHWHQKLINGEISIEEYNKLDPRIRMAPDNG